MSNFSFGFRLGGADPFRYKLNPIHQTTGGDMLDFKAYQEGAMRTAVYPQRGEGNWTYPALGLAGETGEICEKLKKAIRDDGGRISPDRLRDLARELGDVLWYVAALSTELGLELQDIAEQNLSKLRTRQETGRLHGSGDHR